MMKAMILAAGRGERMGALTAEMPKPLLEVAAGEALIERHLRRLRDAGVREIVINLSYRGAQIRARLGDGTRFGVRIRYSDEGEPPLETAGGIVNALPLLGPAPFLLVNSDVLTDVDFARMSQAAVEARDWRGTLVLVPNPPHNAAGDFGIQTTADPGRTPATRARLSATPPLFTYSGIAVFDPALFAPYAPGARPLKPILDAALARGSLDARLHQGLWLDIGTPERLEQARQVLSKKEG